MSNFYTYPRELLILYTILLTASAGMQAFLLSLDSREMQRTELYFLRCGIDFFLLLHILTILIVLAETVYFGQIGLLYKSTHVVWRYFLSAVVCVLLVIYARHTGKCKDILLIPAVLLNLPLWERAGGKIFAANFLAAMLYWLIRDIYEISQEKKRRKSQITAQSIKEATDILDTGLLFYKKSGQILLQNISMQSLMTALTGNLCYNGAAFAKKLKEGQVQPDCRKILSGTSLTYKLGDNSIWQFTFYPVEAGRFRCKLLTAKNITALYESMQKLKNKNLELEQKNRELAHVLEMLESVCESETALQAKSRIHDVLGQRISILLRFLRENRRVDKDVLRLLVDGLPQELAEFSAENSFSMQTLADNFEALGVKISVNGLLPAQKDPAMTMYEIAVEAVTNAVRHSYATEIDIKLNENDDCCIMEIFNKIAAIPQDITEGGGLKGMREKTNNMGGNFSYDICDGFRIRVELPKGEKI